MPNYRPYFQQKRPKNQTHDVTPLRPVKVPDVGSPSHSLVEPEKEEKEANKKLDSNNVRIVLKSTSVITFVSI